MLAAMLLQHRAHRQPGLAGANHNGVVVLSQCAAPREPEDQERAYRLRRAPASSPSSPWRPLLGPGLICEMRVAVMGSGGLGGYFGALLARGGSDVIFIARGTHLQAMQRNGLRIEDGTDPFILEDVHATSDPAEVGPVDLVMVCVKLWDTEPALQQLRPLVGPHTTLVSFQNGVLKDSLLSAAYDESQLIGGVAYVASTVSQPGVITRTGPLQRLVIGEFDGRRSERVEALHAACVAGGIDAQISEDIRRAIWEKFVFLVGLSATTTTMRVPIGPIRELPQSRAFLLDLMREVVAVGRAYGVSLPEDYAQERLEFADSVSPEMTSSMHHDLERGNRLEVRWLSGGVVELGKEVGVDTPLNRAVADILSVHADRRPPH
jgi:2-dehydropantoate 2-reductase